MQEDLTFNNQAILYNARKLKNHGFSSAWSVDGQVRVLETETNKKILIKSVDQVTEMLAKRKGET
jgi:hypothetical protein